MFNCKIFDNNLFVATEQEIASLPWRTMSDFIHLGDYDKIASGLYVDGHMSRGDLYKKYSGLDYDLIDFAVPQELYDPDRRGVFYYGDGSAIFGRIVYDESIWRTIAQMVRDQIASGSVEYINLV